MECPACGGAGTERQEPADATDPPLAVCRDPDCQHVWELA